MDRINQYIESLRADKKSEQTIKNYVKYINEFMRFCDKPEEEIGNAELISYKATLTGLSASSINLRLSAIKSYWVWLEDMDIVGDNPFDKVKKLKNNPKVKQCMTAKDVSKMIAATESPRARAIISILASTGLRFAEMNSITMKQYEEFRAGKTNDIIITGKGNKQRKIYINEKTMMYIDKYIADEVANGRQHTMLFESFEGNVINEANACKSLKQIAYRAGLSYWKEISPHWLRAACATIANKNGVDVATIRDMLGHSNIQTTNRYIKSSEEDVENAMRKELW